MNKLNHQIAEHLKLAKKQLESAKEQRESAKEFLKLVEEQARLITILKTEVKRQAARESKKQSEEDAKTAAHCKKCDHYFECPFMNKSLRYRRSTCLFLTDNSCSVIFHASPTIPKLRIPDEPGVWIRRLNKFIQCRATKYDNSFTDFVSIDHNICDYENFNLN